MTIRLLSAAFLCLALLVPAQAADPLALAWDKNMLTVSGAHIPGGEIKIWYLEAYCRPGSTDRDWKLTTVGHETKLLEASPDKRLIKLKCTLTDGVTVEHEIRSTADEVDFKLRAHNPTDKDSLAHWAQPCIRVARFTGVEEKRAAEEYLPKSFVFLEGKLARMPTEPWAKEARYIPGQVWRPRQVPADDVNPRPVSKLTPSNGLIGCFSADEKQILATAWEPYQELFQGVICCLHSDFRLGGLKAGESKNIRGKLYLVPADVDALVKRYEKDFPEHAPATKPER